MSKKEHGREHTEYETYKTRLGKIGITKFLSRSNLQYKFRKDTLRHAHRLEARIRELKVKDEKLKSSTPKRESIDDWLQKWDVTYTECLDYNISDVQENGAVWDFVGAIEDQFGFCSSRLRPMGQKNLQTK